MRCKERRACGVPACDASHMPLPCSGEEVEKEACFILGLLAIKQEHQHAIADQVELTHSMAGAPACMHAQARAVLVASSLHAPNC